MQIKFTIYGNQEGKENNPIPYTRVVGRALWIPAARKYYNWKEFVKKEFYLQTKINPPLIIKKARMELNIFWKNGKHADPDNIFKGIADALFKNDNNLDGSFNSQVALDKKPKVEVIIKIKEN